MKWVAILALAMVAGAAQAAESTNCQWTINGWRCTEQSRSPAADILLPSEHRARRLQNEALEQSLEAGRAEVRRDAVRRAAGVAASQGRCEDAKNIALNAGEIELAKDVLALCDAP